jgi:hypothetical protein
VTPDELLFAFVRGEVDWRALRQIGVVVRFDRGAMHLEEGPSRGGVRPQAADIEAGTSSFARDLEARRESAAVLLGLTEIDLDGIDESLLETVWVAAFHRGTL